MKKDEIDVYFENGGYLPVNRKKAKKEDLTGINEIRMESTKPLYIIVAEFLDKIFK